MAEETPSKRNDALSVRRYYYKNRYYSPDLGRFIQRDLDGYTAGDSNLYRYVGNNPTNATDPSRLEELFKN